MSFEISPAIQRLFGGETRAKVLGLLANSQEPKTGYELSKALDANPSKVYGVLRGLEGTGFLGMITDRSNYKSYFIADQDLKRFLVKRVRIALEEDWLAPRSVEERERLLEFAKRLTVEIPKGTTKPKNLFNASEFVRPPEKDLALERVATGELERRQRRRRK